MKLPVVTVACLALGLSAAVGKTTRPKKAPAPAPAPARKQPQEPAAIQGTTFAINGWPVKAALVPDKAEVMVGEPLFLTYQLQNAGRVPLTLRTYAEPTFFGDRPRMISLSIADATGQPVPQPEGPVLVTAPPEFMEQSFLPRDKYTARLLLSEWGAITTPGTYVVTAKRIASLNEKETDWVEGTRHSSASEGVISVEARVRVVAADPKRLAANIDLLANKMLTGKDDDAMPAAQTLAAYDDDRIVAPMIQAMETKEGWLQWTAMQALGRRPAEAAVDALAKKLAVNPHETPAYGPAEEGERLAEEFREDAARVLLTNRHPKAREVLARFRTDANPRIRLIVVRALSRSRTDEDLVLLRVMATGDLDESVRQAAANALK
ncbi:HEAT repeat domain-containing protein [Luteolibacter sp. LG18]|uniref:HEAT repeat domain-containing protein n=1 Tax=Luteolibacter sp. LG18 TaxID=2819286 RepID=UPI002B2F7D11|nr:hypothetical protein llg_35190 [Luteolibacter sp. LG18]